MVNQTLTTSQVDDTSGVEISLAATRYRLNLVNQVDYDYGVVVTATANSRRRISYELLTGTMGGTCNPATWYSNLPNSKTFDSTANGESVSILLDPNRIWYYGLWYSKFVVSENGFLTFDTRPFSDSSPPASLPSRNDGRPNSVVAPYWAILKGGTLRWGADANPTYFVVAWLGPTDAAGNSESFAVSIRETHSFDGAAYADIITRYCSVAGNRPIMGVEDTTGHAAVSDPYLPVNNAFHDFYGGQHWSPSGQTVWTTITAINVIAVKRYDDSGTPYSDDPKAKIQIGNGNGPNLFPGGVNVWQASSTPDYTDPTKVDYSGVIYAGVKGAFTIATELCTASIVCAGTPAEGVLVGGDIAFTAYEVWKALREAQPAHLTMNNASGEPNSVSTANINSQSRDGVLPDFWSPILKNEVWDISSSPTFEWTMTSPKENAQKTRTHYLDISAQVLVRQYSGGSYTEKWVSIANPVTIKIRPHVAPDGSVQGLTWFGRTSPDMHPYNFYRIDSGLPSGASSGYHIDSNGTTDSGYNMFGWTKVTAAASEDYQLDSKGRMVVSGSFKQWDQLPSSAWSQSRSLNLYVIAPVHNVKNQDINDLINNVVKTIQILGPTDGTSWTSRSVMVDLGTAYASQRVKIGIGRLDNQQTDYKLSAEWANVVTDNKFLNIWPSGDSGSASPASGSYYYQNGPVFYFTPGSLTTLTATPATGFSFYSWYIDGTPPTPNVNPLSNYVVNANANVSVLFSTTLTIGAGSNGYTTPGSGTHSYTYGTSVTVSATANSGYRFGYWTFDGVTRLGSSISILMDRPHTLNPTFVTSSQRVLKIWINDATKGSTSPVAGTYIKGNTETPSVTATATSGNHFTYWLLDPGPSGTTHTENPITVTMSDDHELDAYFGAGGGGGGGCGQPCQSIPVEVEMGDGVRIQNTRIKGEYRALAPDPATPPAVDQSVLPFASTHKTPGGLPGVRSCELVTPLIGRRQANCEVEHMTLLRNPSPLGKLEFLRVLEHDQSAPA